VWLQILFLKFSAQLLYFLFFQNFVLKLYAKYFFFQYFLKNFYFLFFTNLIIRVSCFTIFYIDLLYLNMFVQVNWYKLFLCVYNIYLKKII
jgi:hypothetical protein